MKSFFIFSLLIICTFTRLDRKFLKQNGSFSTKFILANWSRCPQVETADSDISGILNQSFCYLTKGKQSFVFVSEDRKWVLKCMRLPRYARRFSFKGKPSSLLFLSNTFQACKWAYHDLFNETQVIYAHLKPTTHFKKRITLIDLLGKKHALDLDDIPFVIQRYGQDFFATFDQAVDKKRLIDQTLELYCRLYEKGFIDRDSILDKNFGIIEGAPFIMDIGQIEKVNSLPSRAEYLLLMTESLRGKLERDSPKLYKYYKKALR